MYDFIKRIHILKIKFLFKFISSVILCVKWIQRCSWDLNIQSLRFRLVECCLRLILHKLHQHINLKVLFGSFIQLIVHPCLRFVLNWHISNFVLWICLIARRVVEDVHHWDAKPACLLCFYEFMGIIRDSFLSGDFYPILAVVRVGCTISTDEFDFIF
jgi:hypothetical protein